jgi:hypothetical protein
MLKTSKHDAPLTSLLKKKEKVFLKSIKFGLVFMEFSSNGNMGLSARSIQTIFLNTENNTKERKRDMEKIRTL